jgi:hypothetical protein
VFAFSSRLLLESGSFCSTPAVSQLFNILTTATARFVSTKKAAASRRKNVHENEEEEVAASKAAAATTRIL